MKKKQQAPAHASFESLNSLKYIRTVYLPLCYPRGVSRSFHSRRIKFQSSKGNFNGIQHYTLARVFAFTW